MSHSETFAGDVKFFLAAEHFPAAVNVLRDEAKANPDGIFDAADDILAIPMDAEPKEAIRLCFDACAWEPWFDKNGDIADMYLTDEGRNYGGASTFDSLFYTIAPYVCEESYISMTSSEGAAYSYYFRGGKCLRNALVDPIREDRVPLRRELLERIQAYLLASDVEGGAGSALAAEIANALRTFHMN